ncbi:unnamed protein product [Prorocentrum cordatum]|uniref:25S rRNA (uridine-N(3))-methyltransferase BMT5-like domain-containing protein n=1 Tax=Prorocentrum cordatum TaxID=2364126 RepID=A0ABN9U0Y0_9DINO|nr:unnamed protein product [Polarella glacialis]
MPWARQARGSAADAMGAEGAAEGEEAVFDGADVPVGEEEVPDDGLDEGIDEAPAEVAEGDAEADGGLNDELDEVGVQEHLKDSVEGSLRLKRLLSRDDVDDGKRQKIDDIDHLDPVAKTKIRQLLTRWGAMQDVTMKHVLEQLSLEELNHLFTSGFVPPQNDNRKSPAELTSQHCKQLTERKLGVGTKVDVITTFKARWKLDAAAVKQLQGLTHKDLRFVLERYDGTVPLEDLMIAATAEMPEEDTTFGAMPNGPGLKTMGRFNRLELIDPLADSAVFGDANLTFSLLLAAHRKDLGHVGRVIATTFEELETLRERYKEIDQSIQTLEEHHAEVYHGVDCTRIAIDPRFEGMAGSLGAVYYNFPHSGAIQGFFDGHPMVNWRHENLMRLFFRALRSFVKPGGTVKVSSNAGAVGVRYSYIIGGALENEFLHVETMPFLEWHLHRYGRSYGDRRDIYKRPDAKNNQSYNAQNAHTDMVYCFAYAPSGEDIGKQKVRLPPTLNTLRNCIDGPFWGKTGAAKASLAKQLHDRFVKEVTGTHVG